jgi:flagellar basal-body rod modification protein FlgD
MDTSAVSGTSSGSLTQSIAGNQKLGQQEFLKLLITQLTNQNPLSPEDDKEFLAQMAQFSTVEGVNNITSSISQVQAAALIGKSVDSTVVTDGVASKLTGVVKAVSFQQDGAHLTVNDGKNDHDITLSQVETIRA